MLIDRRDVIQRALLGATVGIIAGTVPSVGFALSEVAAATHVGETIDELLALTELPGSTDAKAPPLLEIMERRAAMPQIARFAAGIAWREMNADQQGRFVAAFSQFLSVVYARRFQEYSGVGQSGERYSQDGVVDAGRKGILVKTSISRESGAPVLVEWLVTDRPGRTVIADIVIEGISLLITQREEIGGMLEARGGNVEKLIADLAT